MDTIGNALIKLSMRELSNDAKDQIALALLLLKDFKCQGTFDLEITKYIFELAMALGVQDNYDRMIAKIPPMRVVPR